MFIELFLFCVKQVVSWFKKNNNSVYMYKKLFLLLITKQINT